LNKKERGKTLRKEPNIRTVGDRKGIKSLAGRKQKRGNNQKKGNARRKTEGKKKKVLLTPGSALRA